MLIIRVVLPQPEGPTTETNEPCGTEKVTDSIALTSPDRDG